MHRLLHEEIATLRLQVKAGHRDQALKALDERGNAQELVRQQYSGRYPFELLQNANDAAIGASGNAAVRFHVTDTFRCHQVVQDTLSCGVATRAHSTTPIGPIR